MIFLTALVFNGFSVRTERSRSLKDFTCQSTLCFLFVLFCSLFIHIRHGRFFSHFDDSFSGRKIIIFIFYNLFLFKFLRRFFSDLFPLRFRSNYFEWSFFHNFICLQIDWILIFAGRNINSKVNILKRSFFLEFRIFWFITGLDKPFYELRKFFGIFCHWEGSEWFDLGWALYILIFLNLFEDDVHIDDIIAFSLLILSDDFTLKYLMRSLIENVVNSVC